MKKIIFPLVFMIIIIVFFLGFIERDNTAKTSDDEGIVYSIGEIPRDLSKVTNLSDRDKDIICATSKGLVEKDSEGKIIPSLAQEITVRDNGIEYEFLLKDDIYWSNGEKIKPEDISDFFKELIKEEDRENIGAILGVYGAKEFKEGTGTFEKGVAITTTDNSIKIRLNEKNDNFIEELTKPQYRLRTFLPLWDGLKDSYSTILYSGNYSIDSMAKGKIELIKNSKNSNGNVDKITFVESSSDETAMASFEIGETDIVLNPPKSQLERLYDESRLVSFDSNKGLYAVFNRNIEELNLQSRREIFRRISEATNDYEAKNIQRIEVAEGSYFRSDKEDLSKLQTRKVSANADGEWNKPSVVSLLGEDNEMNRDFCKYLSEWFKTKENIILKYTLVEAKDLKDTEFVNRYDLVLVEANGDSKNKESLYESMKYYLTDKEKEIVTKNVSNIIESYNKLEDELFNSYGVLPIYYENLNIAISKNIGNIKFDGNGNIDFSSIK